MAQDPVDVLVLGGGITGVEVCSQLVTLFGSSMAGADSCLVDSFIAHIGGPLPAAEQRPPSGSPRRIGATHYTLLATVEVLGKQVSSWASGFITDATSYATLFGLATVLAVAFLALLVPLRRSAD